MPDARSDTRLLAAAIVGTGAALLAAIVALGAFLDSRVDDARADLGAGLDRLDARMDGLDARMDRLDARMDRLEERMDRLEQRMDGFDARLRAIEVAFGKVDQRLLTLERIIIPAPGPAP